MAGIAKGSQTDEGHGDGEGEAHPDICGSGRFLNLVWCPGFQEPEVMKWS